MAGNRIKNRSKYIPTTQVPVIKKRQTDCCMKYYCQNSIFAVVVKRKESLSALPTQIPYYEFSCSYSLLLSSTPEAANQVLIGLGAPRGPVFIASKYVHKM